jgi:two-component system nitrogen regulation sensor histidine kinase NtrY
LTTPGVGLRGRLLASFVLVGIPPLVAVALAAIAVFSHQFEETASRRLQGSAEAVRERIEQLRVGSAAKVAAIAADDLADESIPADADRTLAEAIGARRDLPAFEIVDEHGRVVSSRHWPAGFGLEEREGAFPGDDALRVETTALGYGETQRLALMPAHPARWRGASVTVRGGVFLDGDFLAGLSALVGADVAFFDSVRGRWWTSGHSPLAEWNAPSFRSGGSEGDVLLTGSSFRWAQASVGPGLHVVVAIPRTELDTVVGKVKRLGLGMVAAALLASLLVAVWLSALISRPIGALAEGARRVARGDLGAVVAGGGPGEIGELARAFNSMTTELEASRERLLQAQRVAAWREMARRLAHELKNPLFPIQLSIETLRRHLDRDPGSFSDHFRDASQTILGELRSLRRIVDEFADFARMPRPERRPLALNDVVGRARDLYAARASGVTLRSELAEGLPVVSADEALLGRALGNLIANALDAMPEGGTLTLRTLGLPDGVAVEVEDTGPGLAPEERERLFTPYYTTKKAGTGLGLAIVQGIVSDHGGRVEVRSAPGQGATFRLVLPITEP